MNLEQIRLLTPQLYQLANKYGIQKIYVFGSISRGDNTQQSDVDLLIEMKKGVSLFGAAGFCYESEKLLGIAVDVFPTSLLDKMEDPQFVKNILDDAIAL